MALPSIPYFSYSHINTITEKTLDQYDFGLRLKPKSGFFRIVNDSALLTDTVSYYGRLTCTLPTRWIPNTCSITPTLSNLTFSSYYGSVRMSEFSPVDLTGTSTMEKTLMDDPVSSPYMNSDHMINTGSGSRLQPWTKEQAKQAGISDNYGCTISNMMQYMLLSVKGEKEYIPVVTPNVNFATWDSVLQAPSSTTYADFTNVSSTTTYYFKINMNDFFNRIGKRIVNINSSYTYQPRLRINAGNIYGASDLPLTEFVEQTLQIENVEQRDMTLSLTQNGDVYTIDDTFKYQFTCNMLSDPKYLLMRIDVNNTVPRLATGAKKAIEFLSNDGWTEWYRNVSSSVSDAYYFVKPLTGYLTTYGPYYVKSPEE